MLHWLRSRGRLWSLQDCVAVPYPLSTEQFNRNAYEAGEPRVQYAYTHGSCHGNDNGDQDRGYQLADEIDASHDSIQIGEIVGMPYRPGNGDDPISLHGYEIAGSAKSLDDTERDSDSKYDAL